MIPEVEVLPSESSTGEVIEAEVVSSEEREADNPLQPSAEVADAILVSEEDAKREDRLSDHALTESSEGVSADSAGEGLVPSDTLQQYLAEIRRHPLLDADTEHALAVRWREEGDREAARRLVSSNLRLVVSIARRYERAFRNLLDLVQEGNIGLMEALTNFDPYRGVRFPTYAVWWIRAYVIRYVMNNWRQVKIGTTQAQRKLFFNLQKEKDRLEREGFSPDPKLIADRLAVKTSEVIEMDQRLSGRDLSVDAPVGGRGESTMVDFLGVGTEGAESSYANSEARALIANRIRAFGETLEGKDGEIFEERMIAEDPTTLRELGERYGISRERVRQLEDRIRKSLRKYLVAEVPELADLEVRRSITNGE